MKLRKSRQAGLAVLGLGGLLTGVVTLTSAAAASSPGMSASASTGSQASASQQSASAAATARFWSGTDSSYIRIPHIAGHPYGEPVIGGTYGGYIGMIGNWARMESCTG